MYYQETSISSSLLENRKNAYHFPRFMSQNAQPCLLTTYLTITLFHFIPQNCHKHYQLIYLCLGLFTLVVIFNDKVNQKHANRNHFKNMVI